MALYQNITITQAGASLMSRILTEGGDPLTFEAVAVGSGQLATGADPATLTALINEAKRLPVEAVERNSGRITVSARLATDTLTADIYQREVGIYANGILFAYGNTGDKYDYIPATGKNAAVQKVIRVPLAIGTMQTTFAEMDSTDLMTHAAFNSRLQETIPGMVTAYMNTLVNGDGDIDFFLTVDPTYNPTSPYAQSGKAVAQAVYALEEKSALLASSNKFTGVNTFSGTTICAGQAQFQKTTVFTGTDNYFGSGIRVLPLGVKNALGKDAYGLSVTPPASDGSGGGLQIWGVQFMQGDNWGNTAFKMVHNEISLTSLTESAIGFDYSNVVHFRTFPNDGSAANDGQGAIFDFRAWQWDNDTHDTANGHCPVQILKTNAGKLVPESVLNMGESDERYILKNKPLNAYELYKGQDITTIPVDLSDALYAVSTFANCTELQSIDGLSMRSVMNTAAMCTNCKSLKSAKNVDCFMSHNTTSMYQNCTGLTDISGSNYEYTEIAASMFRKCDLRTTGGAVFSHLVFATGMFAENSNLEEITTSVKLGRLQSAGDMFAGCKLNLASVQHIASSINHIASGGITIGINAALQGNAEVETALNTIRSKGWGVTVEYNS